MHHDRTVLALGSCLAQRGAVSNSDDSFGSGAVKGDPGPWESLVGTGADLRGGSGEVRKDSLKT